MSDLTKKLGSVIVTSDGSSLTSPGRIKTFAMELTASVDIDTIERDGDGAISYASCEFKASYAHGHWQEEADDGREIPYTDNGIACAVNQYLSAMGYGGKVGWSENGRQELGIADFDMDYGLVDEFWPCLAPARGSAPGA